MPDVNEADLHAVWQGTFKAFGVDVVCHVLNDGRRIIEAESMEALMMAAVGTIQAEDLEAFARWCKGGEQP